MIEIKSNVLYTRPELVKMFADIGADWDVWRARWKPVKILPQGWWGRHLIEAMDQAQGIRKSVIERNPGPRKVGRPRNKPRRVEIIDRVLAEVG